MKKILVIVMVLAMLCTLAGCKGKTADAEKNEITTAVEKEQGNLTGKPWGNGGKPIEEYTWEEYLELGGELQEAFYEAFESAEAFDAWLNRVNPDENKHVAETVTVEKPWENGGKAVEQYTWAEFEALNGAQQEAFFEAFVSAEAFEAWRNRVNPGENLQVEETMVVERPWENGGKAVDQYTWAEFEALSGAQQEAFYETFESAEAFAAWRNRVNPDKTVQEQESAQAKMPWENGGKTIEEYTWEEFESLNGEQQEAFFEAFESVEAFEMWMKKAKA